MLAQARRKFKVEGLEFEVEDPRLIQFEDLMQQQSLFPPINNSSFGKATGNLIKSLLNNITGEKGQIMHTNQTNRRQNNSIYHSLPPIGPARDHSESRLPKPKYIL